MTTNININLTDLINDMLIAKGEPALNRNREGVTTIISNNKPNARALLENIIASYYNYVFTGEFKEIAKINDLPQFENITVNANYDLERLQ